MLLLLWQDVAEDEEYEDYSEEDVLDICDKLHRDELLSVFIIPEINPLY